MKFDYQKNCQPLFEGLPERTKEVILRRFGLAGEGMERETLESIGHDLGLTRERVRQIEDDGLKRIKQSQDLPKLKPIFQQLKKYIAQEGGVKREDALFYVFNSYPNSKNWVFFLLTLEGGFRRIVGDLEFHSFWAESSEIIPVVKKTINDASKILEKSKKPLATKEIAKGLSRQDNLVQSSLEISKKIIKLPNNCFGLKTWPEINPRGVKDLAYLVFKKLEKPLHFTDVARMIDELFAKSEPKVAPFEVSLANVSFAKTGRKTHPQTVHNELIKDSRFVLVGRGTYALADWGYKPGVVKDIITDTLRQANKPLSKEEILKKVLAQRIVKENTVLLNLHDRNYFLRTQDGKYMVKEA